MGCSIEAAEILARSFAPVRAAVLLLSIVPVAQALEPSTPLADYARQSWTIDNGLPQNSVQALAQTPDGFVWLGTEAGLVRFDGMGFQVFDRNSLSPLPDNDIRCLLATHDGALWIGTGNGLARWKNRTMTVFTSRDGLPGGGIRALGVDANGVLSVWTGQGRARFDQDRFVAFTPPNGAGSVRPSVAVIPEEGWYIQKLPNGETVMVNKTELKFTRGTQVLNRILVGSQLPGTRIQVLYADREGTLWIGTNRGLARWAAGELQTLPPTDPLAAASVLALMEGREGNLWVGTEEDGLHILRDQRFRTFGAREGLSSDRTTAVSQDSAGTIWVGTLGDGLNALHRSKAPSAANEDARGIVVRTYSVRDGLVSNVILSLAAASNGDLWVGTPDGLNRIRRARIDTFTSADGLPDDFIRSLLVDADGSLWIGTRRGLTHWKIATGPTGGADRLGPMQTFTHENGLGSDLVGAMTRDTNGDLWVATLAGLSRLHDGKFTNYTTADGLSSNVVTSLLPRQGGMLVVGTEDHGWDLWDGQRFLRAIKNGPSQTAIHAIVDDRRGHLWFATDNGIARCDWGKLKQAGSEPDCSHWIDFGAADGLRSRETTTNSHPSAMRSRDGDLWFATPKGVVEVDPAHFPINTLPPPVVLEHFAVDDVNQPMHGNISALRIPAGHVHFQFDYAGLSFTAPQKVRYRYMLEGFDRQWTEAGARRTAYYTNIPPGRYTFRVEAANNDGFWNTTGASLRFQLLPLFYQTVWFYLLLVLAIAGLVVLLIRRRLRHAEHEFRAVLGERNRIAREIHDTLAQGYVGISVQLEVLAELLRHRKVEAATQQLDAARSFVREGLADARQSIWVLRSQDTDEKTLPVKLRRAAELAGGHGLESSFAIFGAYRPLPAEMEREFLRIAQEAIHNVKKHAGAKHLSVQLQYRPGEIVLEVTDDGCGFAPAGGPESLQGHYGLTGMKERAEAIGATLEVNSAPGAGTRIRLCSSVPKEAAEQTGEPQ
jgi:signal transduction histidine kinase/ligand-binding sensor domain-containing protein